MTHRLFKALILLQLGCTSCTPVQVDAPSPACDFETIVSYLERRTTIPLEDRSGEALAAIVASCGKRDELFMIDDDEGL